MSRENTSAVTARLLRETAALTGSKSHTARFFLERLGNLPPSVTQRFARLREEVRNRRILPLKLRELCSLMGVSFCAEGTSGGAQEFLELQKLTEVAGLKTVPGYVCAHPDPDMMLMLTLKPVLRNDQDIAHVASLMERKVQNLSPLDVECLERMNRKMENYNVLLRVFEALCVVTRRALGSSALQLLDEYLKNYVLPAEGEKYLRSCYTFVSAYGSYDVDFTQEAFHYKPLGDKGDAQVAGILVQLSSLEKEFNCFKSDRFHYPLIGLCRKGLSGVKEHLPREELSFDEKVTESVVKGTVLLDNEVKLSQCRKYLDAAFSAPHLLREEIKTALREALESHFEEIALYDYLDFEHFGRASVKNFPLCQVAPVQAMVTSLTGEYCPAPVILTDAHGKVRRDSRITTLMLKAGAFSSLNTRLCDSFLRRFSQGRIIIEGYTLYLTYHLIYENLFLPHDEAHRAEGEEILKTLCLNHMLRHYPNLAFLAALYALFFKCDVKDPDLRLPDYLYPALGRFGIVRHIFVNEILTHYGTDFKSLPEACQDLLMLDVLSHRRTPAVQGRRKRSDSYLEDEFLQGLTTADPQIARELCRLFRPVFLGLSAKEPLWVRGSYELHVHGHLSSVDALLDDPDHPTPNELPPLLLKKVTPLTRTLMGTYVSLYSAQNATLWYEKLSESALEKLLETYVRRGLSFSYMRSMEKRDSSLKHIFVTPCPLTVRREVASLLKTGTEVTRLSRLYSELKLTAVAGQARYALLEDIAAHSDLLLLPRPLAPLSSFADPGVLRVGLLDRPELSEQEISHFNYYVSVLQLEVEILTLSFEKTGRENQLIFEIMASRFPPRYYQLLWPCFKVLLLTAKSLKDEFAGQPLTQTFLQLYGKLRGSELFSTAVREVQITVGSLYSRAVLTRFKREIVRHLMGTQGSDGAYTPLLKLPAESETRAYVFDRERIASKLKESLEVQDVIGKLREENENTGRSEAEEPTFAVNHSAPPAQPATGTEAPHHEEHKEVPVLSAGTQRAIEGLSEEAQALLYDLKAQQREVMDLGEFEGLCLSHRFMSGPVAVEELNDFSYTQVDDRLLDCAPDENCVYIYTDILSALLKGAEG